MDLSHFFARFFGLYTLIMGVFWLTHKEFVKKAYKDCQGHTGMAMCCGSMALMTGLLVLILHPIFTLDWRVVITILFGIIPLLKGLIHLFAIHEGRTMGKMCMEGNGPTYKGIIYIIIGLYLIYFGFDIGWMIYS